MTKDKKKTQEVAFDEEANLRFYGVTVRLLREEQDLSLRELAEKAGISAQALLRIEQGKVNVKVVTLDRVLNALGFRNIYELGMGHFKVEDIPTALVTLGGQLAEMLPHFEKLSKLGVGMEKPKGSK
jgi:transcriptional regulator with XRE-family HTH domain